MNKNPITTKPYKDIEKEKYIIRLQILKENLYKEKENYHYQAVPIPKEDLSKKGKPKKKYRLSKKQKKLDIIYQLLSENVL